MHPSEALDSLGRGCATRCAVFDLDGTLHPDTMAVLLLRSLAEYGLCDERQTDHAIRFLRDWESEEFQPPETLRVAYHLYGAAVAGVPVDAVRRVARRVWRRERSRVFARVRALVAVLTDGGYHTLLISGSPEEIVGEAAIDLGISRYQGAVFSAQDAVYDGGVVLAPAVVGEKRRIFLRLLEGLSVDLGASTAIGNGGADIELLSMVGNPIAFEPGPALREAAIRCDWPIADRTTHARMLLTAAVGSQPSTRLRDASDELGREHFEPGPVSPNGNSPTRPSIAAVRRTETAISEPAP